MNPRKLLVAVIALLMISWPSYSDAGQGCCSYHGGQSYCDTSVGRWVCDDGTYSPSCGCSYIPKKTTSPVSLSTMSIADQDKENYFACSKSLSTCEKNIKEQLDTISEKDSIISTKTHKIYELEESNERKSNWIFWLIVALGFSVVAHINRK
jgi:hypothetical protein